MVFKLAGQAQHPLLVLAQDLLRVHLVKVIEQKHAFNCNLPLGLWLVDLKLERLEDLGDECFEVSDLGLYVVICAAVAVIC